MRNRSKNLTLFAVLFSAASAIVGCAAEANPETPGAAGGAADGRQAGDGEEPGELVDGTASNDDEIPQAPLEPPVSEDEEKTGPATLTNAKNITTKTFSSGIVAVYEGSTWIASFTKNARTVRFSGPNRTFKDPTDTGNGGVTHDEYVRLYPTPFKSFGADEKAFVLAHRNDTSPDILRIGTEYLDGTPLDAKYIFGNDYSDYLAAKTASTRGIDCSGFIRLVYGNRTLPALLKNGLLPRVSQDQYSKGTGVLTVVNDHKQPAASELERLRVGDVVFFDLSDRLDDKGGIDHVGYYIGKDDSGNMRALNATPNNGKMTGPTLGAKFILNGSSFWATHFRGARRL